MVTAQQLIEAGYGRSTANDAGKLSTDNEMLGELNRQFQARYAVWSMAAGDDALTQQGFTFSGSPASVALPTDVIDLGRLEIDGVKANLIPLSEKERMWHLAPAVFRQGLSLVTRAQAGDPSAGSVLTAWIDDAPASLTTLASVIDARFPVRFHNLLILDLALYLDSKDEGRNAEQHAKLVIAQKNAEEMFNALAGRGDSAKDKSTNPRAQT